MNGKVLGHFLRYKRSQTQPADYPIGQRAHRRTPGLTREEVAELANVSVDWVTRIEQGRTGSRASVPVLTALCRVLKLDAAETNYVFHLADQVPPHETAGPSGPDLAPVVTAQLPGPAVLLDQNLTIVTANATYRALYGALSPRIAERNLLWRTFHLSPLRQLMGDWSAYAQNLTAIFRQTYSHRSASPDLYAIFQSIQADPTFDAAWQRLAVADWHQQRLLITQGQTKLYLIETPLQVPETGQILLIQRPGDSQTALALEALWASQS